MSKCLDLHAGLLAINAIRLMLPMGVSRLVAMYIDIILAQTIYLGDIRGQYYIFFAQFVPYLMLFCGHFVNACSLDSSTRGHHVVAWLEGSVRKF